MHLQFNFGFFELGALAGFIDAVAGERAVVITFHATADTPIDGELVSLGSIADALGRADLLIVHQQADLDRLARFGLVDNVRLVPQGAPGPAPVSREAARDGARCSATAQPSRPSASCSPTRARWSSSAPSTSSAVRSPTSCCSRRAPSTRTRSARSTSMSARPRSTGSASART